MIPSVIWIAGLAAGSWYLARPRRLPVVTRDGAEAAFRGVDVSIIVPARNEERNIGHLLMSLAQQRRNSHEVIVVDDASTDGTSAIARAHGASVIRLDGDPPHGWTGKTSACQRGADAATGRVLVFLDADVTVHDEAIDRLVAAVDERGGLVSVQPFHAVRRPHEQLSSVCNLVSMIGSGAFAPWPAPRRPIAFGPCLATTRADYEAIGGHGSVAGEVVEDVQLARRYADRGLPTTAFAGADDVSFRMYPAGLGQLVEGWTKNLTSGAHLADPRAALIAAWWVASCLGLGVIALDVLVRPLSAGTSRALIAAAGWTAVTLQMRWSSRRIGSFSWWAAVLHPITFGAFVGMFLWSAWLTFVRRTVRWSGREIAVDGGPS